MKTKEVTILFTQHTGFYGAVHYRQATLPKAEWEEMTEEDRYVLALELLAGNIDYAWKEKE